MKRFKLSQIICTLLLALLSGCIADGFQSQAYVPDGVFALSQQNRNPLTLEVRFAEDVDMLGHQYLFGLLPFTSLELNDTQQQLYNALFTHLVTSGYNVHSDSPEAPQLAIIILHGHCSAFDLLAIRKNRCSLRLRMDLKEGGRLISSQEETYTQSEYHRFGFKARLRALMEQLLQTAALDMSKRVKELL